MTKDKKELLKKENHWISTLKTLKPNGLNSMMSRFGVLNKKNKYVAQKIHECPLCPHKTKTPSELQNHMKVKHSPNHQKRKLVCTLCTARFDYPSQLNQHMLTKHPAPDAEKCQCEFCTNFYFTEKNLKTHQKRKHNQ